MKGRPARRRDRATQNMKSSKANAIGFLVLVCVAGLGYFGLIHRQNQKISTLKETIAGLTRSTLANEGMENILEQDRLSLLLLEERLDKYTKNSAGKKQIDAFLRRFASDAEEAGVNLSQLRPAEVRKKSWYAITPISVDLEGDFGGMYRLIRGIEKGAAMATLENLRIQSEAGKDGCRATLTVNLYLKPDGGA